MESRERPGRPRLLDQSNAQAIAEALKPHTDGDDPDGVMETHDHWAVGHVDGFSIRVSCEGEITEAFWAYYEIAEHLAEYPILDEEDYSEREYEATIENIADAAWRLKADYVLPDGWEYEAYSWLSEHRSRAIESRSDQGGYPEENDLRDAFKALGYRRTAC